MFLLLPLHPLIPATLAFMTGICLYQGVIHALWLAISAVLLIVYSSRSQHSPPTTPWDSLSSPARWRSWIPPILLLCTAGIIGFCAMSYQEKQFQHAARLCVEARYVHGVVVDISPGPTENSTAVTIEILERADTNHQTTGHHTIPLKTQIRLRATHPLAIQTGDAVEIGPLKLHAPHDSFAAYAMKEGFAATGAVTKKTGVRVVEPGSYISNIRSRLRNHLAATSKQKMSHQSYTLFATIFLGQKQTNQHHLHRAFTHWGLAHQLARSGLHLVIFILILRWFLGYLPLAYRLKQTLLLLCVACYFLLSWPTVSFMRAITTFGLYYLYDTARVQINPIHLLTIAAWIILLPCPIQLFFLDFQLSFGLSYALLLIAITQHQRKLTCDHGPAHALDAH